MNIVVWQAVSQWVRTLPRWQRLVARSVWVAHLAALLLVVFAPQAFAAGLDTVVGFTGMTDSYGVPLGSNRFINGDDSLFDWNGVLPRQHVGGGISTGIINAIGETETGIIVVSVSIFLWLLRVLRSIFWTKLFGSIFATVGFSVNHVLDSAPFLAAGIVAGTLAGVLAIGTGRHTGGRMTIAATWAVGIVGLSVGKHLVGSVVAPAGWIDKIRTVGDGIAGVLMRQGREIGAGHTSFDTRADKLETGFADATRSALQQWMLGRVVDPRSAPPAAATPKAGSDWACSQAWTAGQRSGDPTVLAQYIAGHGRSAPACPKDVLQHIQHVSPFDGVFIALLLWACIGVGAWFAWCGLNCLFRFIASAAFAPAFVVYGLWPSFPRRFLKLVGGDFVVQGLSYGLYTVLTGIYVLMLLTCWLTAGRLPYVMDSVINQLVVTAIVMVLFVGYVAHIRKLHRMATQLPAASDVKPHQLLAPATMAATAGVSAAAAARGGIFTAGRAGGGGVNSKNTSARINAGLQAGQMALSRLHPAAAAAGAIAGGFGSAAAAARGQSKAASQEKKEKTTAASGAGRSPAGAAGAAPGGRRSQDSSRSPDYVQRAQQRAAAARHDAAAVATQTALRRPGSSAGGSRPVPGGGGAGFVT